MNNFFKYVREHYSIHTCSLLKQYSRYVEKLAKSIERSKYLQKCRQMGIIPEHIKNSTNKVNSLFSTEAAMTKVEKIRTNLHTKLLNIEIKETHTNIANIKSNIKIIERETKATLKEIEFVNFTKEQWGKFKNIKMKTRKRQNQKLDKLKSEKFRELKLTFNEEWFVNYTEVKFEQDVKWLLSLGTKFAIPINRDNFEPIPLIADMEQWIQNMNNETEKDEERSKVAIRIANYKRNLRNTEKEKFILSIYEKTRKFIREHREQIIITTADKGNKTVVMYKDEYRGKMYKLLDDKRTYKIIKEDPTEKLQKTNNNLIAQLYKQNVLTRHEKIRMTMHASSPPQLYGLPKIHKENLPLRPISSSTKVPCYNLAKYIGKILRNLISGTYNIRNSEELKEKLHGISLDDDEILVSFDVISLFTNIPIHLAIRNIMRKWGDIMEITKISKQQFLKLLQFCLTDNNYFTFDNNLYIQLYGMPMGNPLSPTIADIVLDTLLDDVIEELKLENIGMKFISKYVDDLFAIIKKSDEATILRTLNNYHNKLQFTIEEEFNGEIAYLDMKIIRENGKLKTNWYTKPTSSGRIINYNSTQPVQMKINTAKNLINKVLKISDKEYRKNNIDKVKIILENNNYPTPIINNLIGKILENFNKDETPRINDALNFYSVPYIPKLTDKPTLKNTLFNDKATIAYRSNRTLRHIFTNNKSKTDKLKADNVVYEIKCKGNEKEKCDMVYIGTTKRTLETRIKEHKSDIKKSKETTALALHAKECNHIISFDDVKILDREKRENKRYTIESLRIQQKIHKTMNTKEDKDNTKLQYSVAIT